jgi:hypothetical protein
MGIRQHRPNERMQQHRDDPGRVYTRTDHMGDNPRRISLDLVKQIQQMTDNALGVDTRWFYYYKRRNAGRRCSCALGEQSSPSSVCGVCYGTGIVGGYDKYGTRTELVDTTFPSLDLINITERVDTFPSSFVLEDGATKGVIRGRLRLVSNNGYVDSMHRACKGNVTITVKRPSESLWTVISSADSFTQFLGAATELDFEITLNRETTRDESPRFLKWFIRYGVLPKDECMLPGDLPTNTESVSLQEYGYDEQFGSVQIVMGAAGKNRTGRITTFTIDDFLFYIERSRYWKLTEVKPNYALGLYTSFDLTARWVQKYEVYQKFPT